MSDINLTYTGIPTSSHDPSRAAVYDADPEPPVTGFMISGTLGVLPLNGGGTYTNPDGSTYVPPSEACESYPFSAMASLIGAGPENTALGLTGSSKLWPIYMQGEEISFLFPTPAEGKYLRLIVMSAYRSGGEPLVREDRGTAGTWVLSGDSTADLVTGLYKYILYDVSPGDSLPEDGLYTSISVRSSGLFHIIPAEGVTATPTTSEEAGATTADIILEEGADWTGIIVALESEGEPVDISADTFQALVRTGSGEDAETLFELDVEVYSLENAQLLISCSAETIGSLPTGTGWWYLIWTRSVGQTLHPVRGSVLFVQS